MVERDVECVRAGCGCALAIDIAARVIRTLQGLVLALTYVDQALAVWDCPDCGFTDAAELAA
jgi:hypothetical protein